MNQKKTVYNLKKDQRLNKFNSENNLKRVEINNLPKYISDNKDKLKDWIEFTNNN